MERSSDYVFNPKVFALARPGAALKTLVAERPMDFWIVVAPSAGMAQWFSTSTALYLFLGGDHYSLGTTIAFSLSKKVRPAIAELVALGHQRIVMPVPEMWHRNADAPTGFETNFQTWLAEQDVRSSSFNTPRFGSSSESLLAMLESTFFADPANGTHRPLRPRLCLHIRLPAKRGTARAGGHLIESVDLGA